MKKMLAMAAAVGTLASAGLIYPQTMAVEKIENGKAELRTATGYAYTIEVEDYDEGDLVACIVFSNGTADIADDQIIAARYSGFRK